MVLFLITAESQLAYQKFRFVICAHFQSPFFAATMLRLCKNQSPIRPSLEKKPSTPLLNLLFILPITVVNAVKDHDAHLQAAFKYRTAFICASKPSPILRHQQPFMVKGLNADNTRQTLTRKTFVWSLDLCDALCSKFETFLTFVG